MSQFKRKFDGVMPNSGILKQILQTKIEEIQHKSHLKSLEHIKTAALESKIQKRPFREAIQQRIHAKIPAVIAELKKASPSKGVIREDFDLFSLSRAYQKGNATCLSVLTDAQYFQGHDNFLMEVRNTVDLPLLRKDFIIDEYQVYESKVLGADAILLIVSALSIEKLEVLCRLALSLGLDVLVEVHSFEEYAAVAHCAKDCLIGVNNRNLKTFEVNTQITLEIQKKIQPKHCCITESGLHERTQIESMMQHGVYGFLIGEAFMRYDNPSDGIATLFPGLSAS